MSKLKLKALIDGLRIFISHYVYPKICSFGSIADSVNIQTPCILVGENNMYFEDNVSIGPNSILYAPSSKIHFKKKSFTGPRLFISTGNHYSKIGKFMRDIGEIDKKDDNVVLNHDVIIEEDVWIGANVSILCERIGRGAIVGCGAVCKNDVPPYTIVGGVPAKVIKLRFTIDEILQHEKKLYPLEQRFSKKDLKLILTKYIKDEI